MPDQSNYIVVACEKCGKLYGSAPEKFNRDEVTFPCRACGATVTLKKPVPINIASLKNRTNLDFQRPEGTSTVLFSTLGLTEKFLLFTIIPLILISIVVVFIADNRMRNLQQQTINSSTHVVRLVSENLIQQISQTVARQTRQYLFSHPDLRKINFNRDIYFKKVVLQKGEWLTWADVDPKMVGQDMQSVKDRLGSEFDSYWRIITGVQSGGVSKGVYKWPDAKGQLREKFAVCTPVEGTPFVISASIFVDEITAPLKKIEAEGYHVASQIRITLVIILGVGLLLIFIILLLYGRSLTSKIKRIADWADAISLGEMESEPAKLHSKDEIGELTEAILRMQESIKLSIDRLRGRHGL
jgi:HAMP domain-containing protein